MGDIVPVTRGVAQGDPLSPVLFNMVLDQVLKQLPQEVGVELAGNTVQYIAFADDTVLPARTKSGLQLAINTLLAAAAEVGLEPGIRKCATMGLITARGSWYLDQRPCYYQGEQLPTIGPERWYKYLGVETGMAITDKGKSLPGKVTNCLNRLQGAPLKPQQKLWGLEQCLLPKFLHPTLFANPGIGTLQSMDRRVRASVRKFLHLPKDTPIAHFHSKVKEGGLGVMSFHTSILALKKRTEKLQSRGPHSKICNLINPNHHLCASQVLAQ